MEVELKSVRVSAPAWALGIIGERLEGRGGVAPDVALIASLACYKVTHRVSYDTPVNEGNAGGLTARVALRRAMCCTSAASSSLGTTE